jgi:hypothetical protein
MTAIAAGLSSSWSELGQVDGISCNLSCVRAVVLYGVRTTRWVLLL